MKWLLMRDGWDVRVDEVVAKNSEKSKRFFIN